MKLTQDHIRNLQSRFRNDLSFSNRFFRLTTGLKDFRINRIGTSSGLPGKQRDDPGAMIVRMEARCGEKDIILAFIDNGEDAALLEASYVGWLWAPYNPVTDEDFKTLPQIYLVRLESEIDSFPDVPVLCVGTHVTRRNGVEKEVDAGVIINLINTRAKSEIMDMIMGEAE